MLYRFTIIALLLFSVVNTHGAKKSQKTKIILFAGQSNCRGKGDFAKLTADDKVLLKKAQKQVEFALFENKKKTVAPLHPFKASVGDTKKYGPEWFFGPELFMGMNLHKQWPKQKFLFIKHAVGGTSLHAAWNINWSADIAKGTPDEKRPRLYYTWIDYVNEVLSTLDMSKYEIVGMIWVQGESDNPGFKKGKKYEYSVNYKKNLTNLINKVRADLKIPKLPFFCLQIGKLPMTEIATEMKQRGYLI